MTVSTVREVMAKQRAERSPYVEVALQDFLDLPHEEQMEFLAVTILQIVEQLKARA